MTVAELIEILKTKDQNAEVRSYQGEGLREVQMFSPRSTVVWLSFFNQKGEYEGEEHREGDLNHGQT